MGSDKEVATSFRRRLSLWHDMAYRAHRVAGQAFNRQRWAATTKHESSRRVLRSPTAQRCSGGGRLPRRQPKSNGNGVAQPKSVRSSTVSHWLGGDEMHARASGGSPSTSDVHKVDKERRKSITTRATPRARSTQARRR
ncbi:hypothetical protein Q7P35_002466 [Cladosporium inversicolor]